MDNHDFLALDSDLDETERTVRDTVRSYATERLLPQVGDWFDRGTLPREIAKELGGLGLLGMQLAGYGCANASPAAYGVACRELEAIDSGLRSFLSVQSCLAMFAIHRWGSEEQRQQWLPLMASGDALGCFGLTEPESGSDPSSLRTTARRDGTDWVIDGRKAWMSNGTIADVAVIWAGTDEGLRGFLVPTSAPGYQATEIRDKLSLRASVSTNLVLDGVRVPASAQLPLARGLKAPLSCLDEARFGIVWGLSGAARTCYGTALEYAGRRHQFGQPIAGFQLIQRKLATMVVELTNANLISQRLAQLKQAGTLTPAQISLGKLANAGSAIEVARTARTILGADGITQAHPVGRHLANLDAVLTVEGTEEVHQLIIGRAVTGIQAFR